MRDKHLFAVWAGIAIFSEAIPASLQVCSVKVASAARASRGAAHAQERQINQFVFGCNLKISIIL